MLRPRNPWLWVDLALKVALVALLVFAVARPDLEQFQGKAMTGRALTYPLATVIVPAVWFWRFRTKQYPYALDILLVLPFLIDTAGNALNLYDTIDSWDDWNHALNWGILTAAFGQLLLRLRLEPPVVFGLALGFGAVTHILWELAEYVTFIRGNPDELRGAYTDTLGDMALSLLGSAIAATLTAVLARRPLDFAHDGSVQSPANPGDRRRGVA